MTVSIQSERRRRRRGRTHARAKAAVFFFGFILVLCQLCVSSAAEANLAPSRWSPARKSRFFTKGSVHAASRTNPFIGRNHKNSGSSDDNLHEDEKRLVHTVSRREWRVTEELNIDPSFYGSSI